LGIEPEDTIALKTKGEIYLNLKQYDNALNDLNRALDIEPKDAIALKTREEVYLNLKSMMIH